MFELILLISLSLYFLQLVIYTIGLNKKLVDKRQEKELTVSVIVAARNEENNILDCIESLNELNYPADKIEILMVNDNSTDKTKEIIEEYIQDKPVFKLVNIDKKLGRLEGKTNALAQAIKISKGEIIITTDADCTVKPNWVKTIVSYFDDDVAMVSNYTVQRMNNAFEGMQSVDWLLLLSIAGGVMNLGKPLSCIGNNMAYRRSVYDELGGYEGIPFSVTEDFMLMLQIHKLKKYKIIHTTEADALVISKPCPDMKTLYSQKKRWGVGGLDSDMSGFGVMAVGWVLHMMLLISFLFFSKTILYLIFFKVAVDYFFIKHAADKLNVKFSLSHFLAFEIYLAIYVICLPFIVLSNPNIKWKDRSYIRKKSG